MPLLEKAHRLRHVAPAAGAQLVDGHAGPCSQPVPAGLEHGADRVGDRALVRQKGANASWINGATKVESRLAARR